MRPRPRIAKVRFYSVADFNREFANDAACLEYIKEQRCPNESLNARSAALNESITA